MGGSRREHFVARALNKNKKPESIIKRARNYFLGSFGSPCSFSSLQNPPFLSRAMPVACGLQLKSAVSYTIPRLNARICAHHAVILLVWPNIPSNSASHAEEAVPVIPNSRASYATHPQHP
ncbi:hypothetical protein EMIT0347P_70281 [Pseudomonas sp. IT-347P]